MHNAGVIRRFAVKLLCIAALLIAVLALVVGCTSETPGSGSTAAPTPPQAEVTAKSMDTPRPNPTPRPTSTPRPTPTPAPTPTPRAWPFADSDGEWVIDTEIDALTGEEKILAWLQPREHTRSSNEALVVRCGYDEGEDAEALVGFDDELEGMFF